MKRIDTQRALIVFLVLVFSALCVHHSEAQEPQSSQTRAERERAHSKEMNIAVASARTIPESLARTNGNLEVGCLVVEDQIIHTPPESEMEGAALESDLVVTGTMGSHVSHLTADERFIYTDWSFTVDEVLLNNDEEPAAHGDTFTVGLPGGQLAFSGRTVTAKCVDYEFVQFGAKEEYLLFLSFMPGSHTYNLKAPFGFALSGSKITGLNKYVRDRDWISYDRDRLFSTVRFRIAAYVAGRPHGRGLYRSQQQ